jgi:prevent-host-death family protein
MAPSHITLSIMRQIAAAKFKTQCLKLLDSVDPEGLIITRHGRPVAKLIPMRSIPAQLIGSLKGKVTVRGDILTTRIGRQTES